MGSVKAPIKSGSDKSLAAQERVGRCKIEYYQCTGSHGTRMVIGWNTNKHATGLHVGMRTGGVSPSGNQNYSCPETTA